MKTRVVINGASGKMGQLACDALKQQESFEIVAKLGRKDNLRQSILETKASIVIDLTCADVVYNHTLTIIECSAHPIIGTSGLLPEQVNTLIHMASKKKLGGIIVPNFSIAAVLMMHLSKKIARYLNEVEIIEAHHQEKYDAPSGTAMRTAEMISHEWHGKPQEKSYHQVVPHVRGGNYHGIPIHSIRLPGVLARQQVIFGNTGETLTLSHDTIDRCCFMPGLIYCCKKVHQLSSLYYGLDQLMFSLDVAENMDD